MSAIQTFKSLQDQVLYWLDEAGDRGTSLVNVQHAINMAHQHRLAQQPWKFLLWDTAVTLTLVAGQRTYALHQEFWRPKYFYSRTAKRFLREVPARQTVEVGADWENTTGGSGFQYGARMCVQAQPTVAATLTLVSTEATDTGAAKAVTIRGETAYGVTTEVLTPNGTTAVVGTTEFTKILGVSKGAAWAGRLTLSQTGGGTLLTLFANEYGRSYQTIELLWTPSASETIEYRFYRQPTELVNDYDLPDLPPPHAQILVPDALLMFVATNTDIRADVVAVWRDMQTSLETDLLQTQSDGQTIGAVPQSVLSGDDDDEGGGSPRVTW